MKEWTFLIFFGLLSAAAWAQGPISGFLNSKGTTDFALGYAYEHFNDYLFGTDRQRNPLTTHSANIFVEHSLSSRGALVANIPYVYIDEVNQGLQDGNLFLKFRNGYQEKPNGNLSTFTAVGITTPLSRYPTGTENPIGLGAFAFQGRLLLQYNTHYGFFFHLQSGADFRFLQQLQTSIPILARAGFGSSAYFVEAWVEWYNTLDSGVDQQVTGGSGANWLRLGTTLYVPVYEGLGVALNTAWITGGRNIGLSSRYGLSLVYRLGMREK